MSTITNEQIVSALKVFERCDIYEGLFWRSSYWGPLNFYVNCNDLFCWATADLEEIQSDEDIALLNRCADDLLKIESESKGVLGKNNDGVASVFLCELYAARRRHMRPQRPFLYGEEHLGQSPKLKALFEACGPERGPKEEGEEA